MSWSISSDVWFSTNLDLWYPVLAAGGHTFQTEFIPLTFQQQQVLLSQCHRRQAQRQHEEHLTEASRLQLVASSSLTCAVSISASLPSTTTTSELCSSPDYITPVPPLTTSSTDSSILSVLISALDSALSSSSSLSLSSSSSFCPHGGFVKLSSRSPKDASVDSDVMRRLYQDGIQRLEAQRLKERRGRGESDTVAGSPAVVTAVAATDDCSAAAGVLPVHVHAPVVLPAASLVAAAPSSSLSQRTVAVSSGVVAAQATCIALPPPISHVVASPRVLSSSSSSCCDVQRLIPTKPKPKPPLVTDNDKVCLLYQSHIQALMVTTGHQALDLLTSSQRIEQDLELSLQQITKQQQQQQQPFNGSILGADPSSSPSSLSSSSSVICSVAASESSLCEPPPLSIVVRAWVPNLKIEHEFRGFVYNGKLTALSQYFDLCHFPSTFGSYSTSTRGIRSPSRSTTPTPILGELPAFTQSIVSAIRDFHATTLAKLMPSYLTNYIIDFAVEVSSDDEDDKETMAEEPEEGGEEEEEEEEKEEQQTDVYDRRIGLGRPGDQKKPLDKMTKKREGLGGSQSASNSPKNNSTKKAYKLKKIWVIELNPWSTSTDSCLFDWTKELVLLQGQNELFTFRCRQQPMRQMRAIVIAPWQKYFE